jgi:pyridine nucleotide-disulfide oxidoreductase family protein
LSIRRLVLAGGGHAHVHVLADLAREPIRDCEIVLVSPYARQVYSGMLPGWVAGHYALDDCAIDLRALAGRAGVTFVQSAVQSLDAKTQRVTLANNDQLGYDWLSLDTGPVASLSSVTGIGDERLHVRVLLIRPIEQFINRWQELEKTLIAGGQRILIAGGGAAGCELALAIAHRAHSTALAGVAPSTIMLATADDRILPTLPSDVAQRVQQQLTKAGVAVYKQATADAIQHSAIHLSDGHVVEVDHVLFATGTAAAQWPRMSGLAVDERGFVLTNAFLQSTSHPNVFAAGDCSTSRDFQRPKSGVFAVRAGPPLARNLRATLSAKPLNIYKPQSRSLYLLSCGAQYAVASWGGVSFAGRWVWHWKNRIDRAFVDKYRNSTNKP